MLRPMVIQEASTAGAPILIRADGGAAIGNGHVTRCRVLARALVAEGVPVVFLCRALPAPLADLLRGDGIRVRRTADPPIEDEAGEILAVAAAEGAQAVVIDHYGIGRDTEARIRRAGVPVMAVDDLYAPHDCNLLLNQNLYADRTGYAGRVPGDSRILTGWRYALLREEFTDLPRRSRARPDPAATRILVSLGGADTPDVTRRVIDALGRARGRSLRVEVIVGASNVHRTGLLAAAAASPANIEVLTDVADMARRMDRADLAITAGGTTHLELVAAGLPAVLITIADNQELVTAHMSEQGLAVALGWHEQVNAAHIAAAVEDLLDHPTRYDDMHRRLAAFGPAGGAHRVARALLDLAHRDFALVPADPGDLMDVFHLSNDIAVRSTAFGTAPIPLAEHRRWYPARLHDTGGFYYTVRDRGGVFIGQIRLDRGDPGERRWTVTFSLIAAMRGRGLGRLVLRRALDTALRGTGPHRVDAWVKVDNAASLRSFLDAGFCDDGVETVRGVQAHRLVFRGE